MCSPLRQLRGIHTLNLIRIMVACVVSIGWSAACFADTMVITYTDGSSQKVPLNNAVSAISSLQYLKSEPAPTPTEAVKLPPQDSRVQPVEPKPASDAKPEPKSNIKFKWAEPMPLNQP
jgi:hypothetical protein